MEKMLTQLKKIFQTKSWPNYKFTIRLGALAVKSNLTLLLKSGVTRYLLTFILVVFLLDLVFPLPKPKPYSKVIYASDGSMLTAYLSKDEKWRMQIHLNEVTNDLIKAIIEKEDSWFYWHYGVNPYSLIRAAFQNITSQRRISGASTITMQVVRMLQPAKRTYLNKLTEIFRAVQLELHYSKDEILEMYLNLLPYGGNIEGVKSAAYIYFNRPPGKLSLSQSVLLTVIPTNPNELRPDQNLKEAIRSRNNWLKIFMGRKTFDKQELTDALEEQVNVSRYSVVKKAPHFCRYVSNNYMGNEIRTTLNSSIQETAEKLLSGYIERVRSKGISNGAVIIVQNKTNSVVGYCGSYNFEDSVSLGQINGVTAVRSPGSTLKPALYAMAFDEGILTPAMRLLDIPTDFNGYEPENFDEKFRGNVTAKYALVNSLNIPAVQLLQQVGPDKFISVLDKAGFSEISKNKNSLGLSLILGGCGVKLEQLVHLYSAFSHEGKIFSLNYLKDQPLNDADATRLFTPASSFLISTILSSNERPDFPAGFLYTTNLPKIAWKTGTSFGKHDAWAIGYNPDYTIGVWLGNFDVKGSPDLTGAGAAVPLLFELFNSIDFKPKKLWFDTPANVLEREVCSETGLLPSDNCSNLTKDYYIRKVSPNNKCDLYKSFYVDAKETMQYCTECLPDSGYKKVSYPVYKSELTLWYLKNKIQVKKIPPHNALCQARHSGDGPKILSPQENYEYYIEANTSQQIYMQAASDPSIKNHYWYIDNEFYKKSLPGDKIFFTPRKGESTIACIDDLGREEIVKIKVNYY